MLLLSITTFAQSEDPYKIFGHNSTVEYKMPVTEMLYIKNKDTNSEIKAMAFDIENNQIKLLGKNDSLLSVESLKGNKLLRWLSLDPKSQKYVGFSPYNFVLNNPIRNFDPDGQEVWINYGDNQKVRYENGNLFNADGSAYKGTNDFVKAVSSNLNSINSVTNGNRVISGLVNSKEVFTYVNSAVPGGGGDMGFQPGKKQNGGTIYANALMSNSFTDAEKVDGNANELFGAYQQISGEKGNNLNKEVASFLFSFGVAESLYPNYNPHVGDETAQGKGAQFDVNMEKMLTSDSFDPKLYSQTVKQFPTSGRIGRNYSSRDVPLKPNVKNPTISTFFPLLEKK